jgi:hypothetical protein
MRYTTFAGGDGGSMILVFPEISHELFLSNANSLKKLFPFKAFPARHRFLQKAHQPDAVAAPLHAAVLAFP